MENQAHLLRRGDTVCGYVIVNKLHAGPDSRLYVAKPPSSDVEQPSNTDPGDVIIKIMWADEPPTNSDMELNILDAVRSPYVIPLLDYGSDRDGRAVLVFPHLTSGSLADLLRKRSVLRAGEAVSIIGPILQGLIDVNGAGYVHGSLGAKHIHFDSANTPVLLGFGQACALNTARDDDAAVIELDRTIAIMGAVLGRVDDDEAMPLIRQLHEIRQADPAGVNITETLARWLEAVLSWATPTALHVTSDNAPTEVKQPPKNDNEGHLRAKIAGVSQVVGRRIDKTFGRIRPLTLLMDGFRKRRRVVFTGGAVAVALSTLLLVLPATDSKNGSPGDTSFAEPIAHPANASGSPVDTTEQPHEPPPAGQLPPDLASSSPPTNPVLAGEDALEAVRLLLEVRARCFDDVSLLCLEHVDQPASPLLAEDREALRSGSGSGSGSGSPTIPLVGRIDTRHMVVEERDGNAVLIRLNGSDAGQKSIVTVRGPEGWRLRDIFGPNQRGAP